MQDHGIPESVVQVKQQIIRGSSLAVAGSLIAVCLGYASTFAIVRLVPVESYGEYQLALSLVAVLEKFVLLGLPFAVIRYVAYYATRNDSQSVRQTVSCALWLTAAGGVILILLSQTALLSVPSKYFPFPQELLPILQIAVLLVAVNPLKEICVAALRGMKRVDLKVAVEDIMIPTVKLLLVLVVLSSFPNSIALINLHIVSILIGVVLVLYLLAVQGAWSPRALVARAAETKRTLLRFSLPLLGSNLANVILTQADRILLGILAGSLAVGVYSAAQKIAALIIFPYAALALIFEPIIAQLYTEKRLAELAQVFKSVTVWSMGSTLPIGLLLIIFGREILMTFGIPYAAGYTALIFLVTAQTIQAGFGHVGQMLVMTGRVRLDLVFMALSALLSVGSNYMLIQAWGMDGAALAVALTLLFGNLLALFMVWITLRMHPFKLQSLKVLSAGVVAFVPSYALQHGLTWPLWASVPIALIVFISFYLAALWMLRPDATDWSLVIQIREQLKARLRKPKEST